LLEIFVLEEEVLFNREVELEGRIFESLDVILVVF